MNAIGLLMIVAGGMIIYWIVEGLKPTAATSTPPDNKGAPISPSAEGQATV